MRDINVLNFRQFGGYQNKNGKHIKDDIFFRGGPLVDADLTKEDKEYLDSIGFKHIIDFRSEREILRRGALYTPKGALYENLPSITKEMDSIAYGDLDMEYRKSEEGVVYWLERVYKMLPINSDAYQKVMDYIKKGETPIYFHCSAGKDRTGVCGALILLALGMDEEDIYEDYLKSYDNMVKDMARRNLIPERPNLVFREWLENALNAIKETYGSYDQYLKEDLKLSEEDLKRLEALYLE